jgi:hypothetical protein
MDDKLAFDGCKEPSVGLVERWCYVNFEQCEGDEIACPGYAWRCTAYTTALRAKHAMLDAGARETTATEPAGCSVNVVRSRGASCLLAWFVLLLTIRMRRLTSGSCSRRER